MLDTNVISELMRPQPHPQVLAWVDGLDPALVAITAMNEAEILHGIARLPDGRRKQSLQQNWDELVAEIFAGRVWPFSSEAAHWYAHLLSARERLARPMATADAVIADVADVETFVGTELNAVGLAQTRSGGGTVVPVEPVQPGTGNQG